MSAPRLIVACAALATLAGCVEDDPAQDAVPADSAWASEVVVHEPGDEAGFGQDAMPDIVLGPPGPGSEQSASLDVLSLGRGGSITLGFGGLEIVDGPGADFVVFENPFYPAGNAEAVFAELGEVSVSEDGESWVTFTCTPDTPAAPGQWPGCAGWTPRRDVDPAGLTAPWDPAVTGGDGFDLADVGLTRAVFVRVRDVSDSGAAPSAGFDLDAVGLVNYGARPAAGQ